MPLEPKWLRTPTGVVVVVVVVVVVAAATAAAAAAAAAGTATTGMCKNTGHARLKFIH